MKLLKAVFEFFVMLVVVVPIASVFIGKLGGPKLTKPARAAEKTPGSLQAGNAVWNMKWAKLSRAQFGDKWPLTGETAWIGCTDIPGDLFQVVVLDGVPHAWDGLAKSRAKIDLWTIDGARVLSEESPEPWRRPHPNIPELRMSADMFFTALQGAHCD